MNLIAQQALKIATDKKTADTARVALQYLKNSKFIKELKFEAATKWARTNLLKEKPLPRFIKDPKNPGRLLRK